MIQTSDARSKNLANELMRAASHRISNHRKVSTLRSKESTERSSQLKAERD